MTEATTPPPLVQLRGLTKIFREGGRERRLLDSVDGVIGEGELVVLLGKSGSGKSTLLNLLGGIDLPSAGEVLVQGVSLGALDEEERTRFRRDHVGFVFQFFNLIPTLTVEENLLLPLELKGRTAPSDRDAALELLAEVGLGDRAESFPDRLSGGEQQRVAVARALAHDPLLVLADEPTGNLDHETGQEVLNLLDRLTRRAGKTMVMVTHSREAVGVADRVLTIADGALVERSVEVSSGTPPDPQED
ncbi:MAG: ABC transporter ATP-binding protein [Acidobacteriota bacterium]|nr:ABC transporter ATP-binding protein [Acidobacteriota bacterium]